MISKPVIEYNADMNLLVNSTGTSGYWYNHNELLSSEPSTSFVPDHVLGGNYTVEVINDGCSFISDAFIVTDIITNEKVSDISIAPNPASDYIEIKLEDFTGAKTTIGITDINGKVYLTDELSSPSQRINLKNLHSGVYILVVESQENLHRIRFIKI
jgi:hypothetical protein